MGIHKLDIYRSPNIGVFLKINERFLLAPVGLAQSKVERLSKILRIEAVQTSIASSRLLGPLVAMNSMGILVSRLVTDSEILSLRRAVGIPVETLDTRYTCVGNLIAANDRGGVVSPILPPEVVRKVSDVLNVPLTSMNIASYSQVGSLLVATNEGGVIHPRASEEETARAGEVLRVEIEPCTVNGGVPFVSSGVISNSKEAVAGNLTSGPELVILARALKI